MFPCLLVSRFFISCLLVCCTLCKPIDYANIRNMWIQKVKNTIFFSKSFYP